MLLLKRCRHVGDKLFEDRRLDLLQLLDRSAPVTQKHAKYITWCDRAKGALHVAQLQQSAIVGAGLVATAFAWRRATLGLVSRAFHVEREIATTTRPGARDRNDDTTMDTTRFFISYSKR